MPRKSRSAIYVSLADVKPLLLAALVLIPASASAHLIVDVGVAVRAPAYAQKSSQIVYAIDVTDYAYDGAYGIVVYDILANGVKFVSASGSGWNCSVSGNDVTCSAEAIYSGTSTITIKANAPATTGSVENQVMMQSIGSLDPVPENDNTSATTFIYDPAGCGNAGPVLAAPANGTISSSGNETFAWSPVPGAAGYRVWAAVEGAAATLLRETTSTSLSVNAEKGLTEWWVDALFDACPPVSSAHASFTSGGHPYAMSVSDLAGQPGVAAAVDGPAASASFANPVSVGTDIYGNTYVLDRDASTVRGVAANGDISTVSGITGQTGAVDGTLRGGTMNHPSALTVTNGGYVYIADTDNQLIRRLYPNGNGIVFGAFLATFAGSAGVIGTADGSGSNATFSSPAGVAVAPDYTLYVADTGEHRIRKIDGISNVSEVAGIASSPGAADGPATSAQFNSPTGLALDSAGNLYVADTGNDTIRRIGNDGNVTTIAGTAGAAGFSDGAGAAARFNHPTSLAFDALGNLYVADSGNNAIRRIAPSHAVTTLIGNGQAGHQNGDGAAAELSNPVGIAFDASGRLLIADSGNRVLRVAVPGAPAAAPTPPARRHRAVSH
jgi:sugar lactone lactonase YvrE